MVKVIKPWICWIPFKRKDERQEMLGRGFGEDGQQEPRELLVLLFVGFFIEILSS